MLRLRPLIRSNPSRRWVNGAVAIEVSAEAEADVAMYIVAEVDVVLIAVGADVVDTIVVTGVVIGIVVATTDTTMAGIGMHIRGGLVQAVTMIPITTPNRHRVTLEVVAVIGLANAVQTGADAATIAAA